MDCVCDMALFQEEVFPSLVTVFISLLTTGVYHVSAAIIPAIGVNTGMLVPTVLPSATLWRGVLTPTR